MELTRPGTPARHRRRGPGGLYWQYSVQARNPQRSVVVPSIGSRGPAPKQNRRFRFRIPQVESGGLEVNPRRPRRCHASRCKNGAVPGENPEGDLREAILDGRFAGACKASIERSDDVALHHHNVLRLETIPIEDIFDGAQHHRRRLRTQQLA
jgi:hypothetical protein